MKNKLILLLVLAASVFDGCKSESIEEISQTERLLKALCYDGVYAEYHLGEYTSSGRYFKAPERKNTYRFYEDGTGTLSTCTFDLTWLGYRKTDSSFTWEIEEGSGLTLRMKTGSVGVSLISDIQITEEGLKFKSGEWLKELEYTKAIKKSDLISYKIEQFQAWSGWMDLDGNKIKELFATPTLLTFKTKQGVYRFWTRGYVHNAHFYENRTIYLNIDIWESISTVYCSEHREFERNNSKENWFPIGHIDEDGKITHIDNGKEYTLE